MKTKKCSICGKSATINPEKGDIFNMPFFGMHGEQACSTCVGEEKGMFFDIGFNTWLLNPVLNLTQHVASKAQKEAGVIDLPEAERTALQGLLTFDTIPSKGDLAKTARAIAKVAAEHDVETAMIGGAPFFMGHLERALEAVEIQPVYAFSKRVAVETDGVKKSIFVHEGFVGV